MVTNRAFLLENLNNFFCLIFRDRDNIAYSLVVILFVAAPATAFGTPAAQRDNFVVSGSGHC